MLIEFKGPLLSYFNFELLTNDILKHSLNYANYADWELEKLILALENQAIQDDEGDFVYYELEKI